jgi:hypothetical protein
MNLLCTYPIMLSSLASLIGQFAPHYIVILSSRWCAVLTNGLHLMAHTMWWTVLWLVYQELHTGMLSALSDTLVEAVLLNKGFKLHLYTWKFESGSLATGGYSVLRFIMEITYFERHRINLMIITYRSTKVVCYLMCSLSIFIAIIWTLTAQS